MKQKASKGFKDAMRLFGRIQFFHLLQGKLVSGKFRTSWKKCFENGVVIYPKIRTCEVCSKSAGGICESCE